MAARRLATVRRLVVDASISAAWFLPDEATDETESVLQATATHDVWVPALWLLEIANLLPSARRRKRISAEDRQRLVAAAASLRIKVDREAVSIMRLDELAAQYALSAHDAAYLEVALRRRLPLVTRDNALSVAMTKAGVSSAWA